MAQRRRIVSILYALFFFSGSAGLGYQMVWSKMFATGLGHEMPAVLAVVGAFLGGMALGAWTLDGPIRRSRRPWRWFGSLEIVVGLWGLLSTVLIPVANQSAWRLISIAPSAFDHWCVAFALPFVALLPATAAMGATLPAIERFVAPLVANCRCVGALYGANTLGAVAGILATTFVVAPPFGLRHAAWLLAGINLLSGAATLFIGARLSPAYAAAVRDTGILRIPGDISRPRLGATLCFTGLLGIGYETVGVRVLSQVLENTVYTFAAVLTVFLLGTSIGAALYQRFGQRPAPRLLLTDLLGAVSSACMLGALVASRAQPIYDYCRAMLGDGTLSVLAAELAVASTVLLVPTLFMGATFSHLVQAAARHSEESAPPVKPSVSASPDQASIAARGTVGWRAARRSGGGVGRAAALNTLGGAVASALFGVLMLPLIGSKWTLMLISLGYLLLVPKIVGWRWGWLLAPAALACVLPANFQLVQVPPGGRVVAYREGVMASVAVVEDAKGDRVLRVDNRFQMGGTAAAPAEYRHAHIPLLLHPAPRRALFLGLGTGITFGAAASHRNLQSDGVELVPEVVEVMPLFEPCNFSPGRQPRLKLFVADARRFVRAADANYDVIVADLFHPARDGAGSLYTLEHFQSIRRRLATRGLFCQWLPLHQLDENMLRVIIRTFLEVFPDAQAWLLRFNVDAPVLGLIGSLEPPHYAAQWVEDRLSDPDLEPELKKLALADSIRLFGNLLAGPQALRGFAGAAPPNTDDRPRVTFGAPRFTYQRNSTPYGRLLTLLHLAAPDLRETLGLDSGDEAGRFAARLTRYMTARNTYLEGLVEEFKGRENQAIDLFVESSRLSDDFTTGYAQCLTLASALARSKPAEARALLERLVKAQPARPVAKELLERLSEK
jgi:spermidine synthase